LFFFFLPKSSNIIKYSRFGPNDPFPSPNLINGYFSIFFLPSSSFLAFSFLLLVIGLFSNLPPSSFSFLPPLFRRGEDKRDKEEEDKERTSSSLLFSSSLSSLKSCSPVPIILTARIVVISAPSRSKQPVQLKR